MKLLLVTDAVGGVWVYSLELARALQARGVEPVLAVMGPSPSAEQRTQAGAIRLIDTGLPLDWLDTSPTELRRAGVALAAIAAREGADVVQTCSAALLADADFAQPTVAVQHSCVASWWAAVKGTPLPAELMWRRELVECGLNRASAVVAPSTAFAAETARLYDLGRPVLPVHNGRAPAPASAVPQGDFVFTAARLWDEGKNVATLDKAAARLNVRFEAAGAANGPSGAHVRLDHLHALGELGQARLAGLLAARPVFASAALYEPFGLSVLEAASAGCALVLSDIPTHRELWGGAAIFVPARDDAAFAAAIGDVLNDRRERAELGELAQIRAARFTPAAMAARMVGLYAQVAGDAAPAPRQAVGAA